MPPVALVICDGLGYRTEPKHNAVAHAKTPCLDTLWNTYPHTLLCASGPCVGLPSGYIGNSEVGHMTIGCGKIIEQPVTQLNTAIKNNTLKDNPLLQHNFSTLASTHGRLHIMGLVSDAGVHAHIEHMIAFARIAHQYTIQTIWLHLFLDGRDSPPQSALSYIKTLENTLQNIPHVHIGSLTGRFFAMDRDANWERTCNTLAMLVDPDTSIDHRTPEKIISDYYHQNITDEFIPPTLLDKAAQIHTHDGILCTHFRPDRIRQLTLALTKPQNTPCSIALPQLSFFITPTLYSKDIPTMVLLDTPIIEKSLKKTLAAHHKTIFTIAETEKYAHVTYFFSGGREAAFPEETRVLIPSIPARNYVNHPCMSAPAITEHVLNSLQTDPKDFYLINYANADMVGHSGNFEATVKAVECLDTQIKKLYEHIVLKKGGSLFITADHGNAEQMYDEKNKQPHTAHTTNPVPFIAATHNVSQKKVTQLYELKDITPFLLQYMNK